MRFFKFLSLCMTVVLIMFGVSGCMKDNKVLTETTEKITETKGTHQGNAEKYKYEVLAHLSEKYNKEFECKAYQSPSVLIDYYTFVMSEKTESEKPYKFKAFYYPNGEKKFSDGYFGKFLCEQVENYIAEFIGNKNCKAFVRTTAVDFDESLNSSSSLADILVIEKNVDVSIYIFGIDNNLKITDVASDLASKGLTGMIFYYCIDGETVKNISKENYSDVLSEVLTNKINVEFETECQIK